MLRLGSIVARRSLLKNPFQWVPNNKMSHSSSSSKERTLREAVEAAESYFRTNNAGPQADVPATATLDPDAGLRCKIECPNGNTIYTDMPQSIGGTATANSPGWHLRAALASCDATLLAIRAARTGLVLDKILVKVEGSSDGRGMLLDDTNNVSAGSHEMKVCFQIASRTATKEQIEELIHWVDEHSPVGTDIKRAVDLKSELQFSNE